MYTETEMGFTFLFYTLPTTNLTGIIDISTLNILILLYKFTSE